VSQAREEFLRAYVAALCQLRVLTPGLSKLASEEAARVALERLGFRPEGPARAALASLLELLGVAAEVVDKGEVVEVRVGRPCPLSWPGCEELCPLPHIASTALSQQRRWHPRRLGGRFVEVSERECRFELARPPEGLEE